jgi:hypothetical protein
MIRAGILVAGTLAAGVAGCVPYKQPPLDQPAANLRIVSSIFGMGMENTYYAYDDPNCMKEGGGYLGSFPLDGNEKTVRLWADRPVYLWAKFKIDDSVPGMYFSNSCANIVSFVPVAGRHYQAKQTDTTHECSIKVIDRETNAPPPTFQNLFVPASCQ